MNEWFERFNEDGRKKLIGTRLEKYTEYVLDMCNCNASETYNDDGEPVDYYAVAMGTLDQYLDDPSMYDFSVFDD